jgi:hypothetical protein
MRASVDEGQNADDVIIFLPRIAELLITQWVRPYLLFKVLLECWYRAAKRYRSKSVEGFQAIIQTLSP